MNDQLKQAALEAFNKRFGTDYRLIDIVHECQPAELRCRWEDWLRSWQLATQAAYERAQNECRKLDYAGIAAHHCAEAIGKLYQGELEAPAPVNEPNRSD